MEKELNDYFQEHGIEYKEYKHKPVFTVAESKDIKKEIPGISTKSLFLKDDEGNFYLVCLPGEKRLNIKLLRKELSKKKLQFASEQELKTHLNVTPGSVSLFCMIHPKEVNLILDKEIWDSEFSGFHPNINTSTLLISHNNLEKFYNSLSCKKQILSLDDGS